MSSGDHHLANLAARGSIVGFDPPQELVAEAVSLLRTLFSPERIAAALHARAVDAAATYPEPIYFGTCDEDGHLEEARDIHRRVMELAR